MNQLEVFDLTKAVLNGERDASFCERLASSLHETSCLVVKDPRVTVEDNDRFLDLMEKYFMQPMSFKKQQARPELHHQVGLTPEGVEIPEAVHDPATLDAIQYLSPEDRPFIPKGPDPKCRYMWRIGPRPSNTAFWELNAEPVVPDGFDEWSDVLNSWGEKLLSTICTVSELVSVGLGWEDASVLKSMMHQGPHLLAPTGVDISLHRKENTPLAGYHSDLNLLTAHGKARYPGLFIWLTNGKRIPVKIPDGCILLQAGMQLERLTGGYITAGMHEVVVSPQTLVTLKQSETTGRSTWRVSSTLFGHIASDRTLVPLEKFKTDASLKRYPPVLAGDYVAEILKRINLFRPTTT